MTSAFFHAPHHMKLLRHLALLAVLISAAQAVEKPSAHTTGTPTGKPTGPLKPGEYWWRPQLSPSGPLIVLVSVPEQVMHVYRNGILIGRSTVSTGSTGHATPGGVFSILEKKQEHYSKTYDNAPMAEHAAPDVDGHRDAFGQSARLSGEPRLHPPAF
jgi:L,D-transpeptidase catalytic domain